MKSMTEAELIRLAQETQQKSVALTESDVRRIVAEMKPSGDLKRINELRKALRLIFTVEMSTSEMRSVALNSLESDEKLARGES